jgi:hypothetical protein
MDQPSQLERGSGGAKAAWENRLLWQRYLSKRKKESLSLVSHNHKARAKNENVGARLSGKLLSK